jgi:ribA/ribD-fused uncharacterized protein
VKYISGFFGEYRFLSNFYPAPITHDGIDFPTTEHAFQAAKFDDQLYRLHIAAAESAGQAKRLGKTTDYPLREGWESGLAVRVMSEVNSLKFRIPELRALLLSTGDAILIEENSWGDDTWGHDPSTPGRGKNQLGIVLMSIRSAIRAEANLT